MHTLLFWSFFRDCGWTYNYRWYIDSNVKNRANQKNTAVVSMSKCTSKPIVNKIKSTIRNYNRPNRTMALKV